MIYGRDYQKLIEDRAEETRKLIFFSRFGWQQKRTRSIDDGGRFASAPACKSGGR